MKMEDVTPLTPLYAEDPTPPTPLRAPRVKVAADKRYGAASADEVKALYKELRREAVVAVPGFRKMTIGEIRKTLAK